MRLLAILFQIILFELLELGIGEVDLVTVPCSPTCEEIVGWRFRFFGISFEQPLL